MGILREILSEMKEQDIDILQQIRELCDQIQNEEIIDHPDLLPKGPNIFLSLEVSGRTKKEIAYLTLERESADLYLAVLYTIPIIQMRMPNASVKRHRVWEIEYHRPEQILTEYAKTYKFLRGE